MSDEPQVSVSAAAVALPVASIGLLDIYKIVIEMQSQLAVMTEQLKTIPDHESRIRSLERFRFTLMGASITVGTLAGTIAAWIVSAIPHRP